MSYATDLTETSASRAASTDTAPSQVHKPGQCTRANEVISLVGDKWSVQIVMLLGTGRHRFMEIKRAIEGISQKMLTVTLRGLERDGYVTRTVYPTIPPKVEYELTDLGLDLLEPLRALGSWALANHDRVVAARTAYDARAKAK
ncbi:HxlR family transcriptional regulator [Breoghania corrubedonensis]|uniref:HxlR family transcriptional regulator n=1 Tax=Breoghania corrubedonensis TaxID=665038 RepID=A0A2T5V4V3_9HYPH|nr:helix-turn-helix domain-containing protein [Breoghania corrubedonensis]PTW58750.1 HxlR family transcriptional regulator [Breoghania corrubedonensis]